jgi:hypothetical protein
MKAKISLGPRPSIMGKGSAHQLKNEYIPDVQSELEDYYDYLLELKLSEEGEQPSEALTFALHA